MSETSTNHVTNLLKGLDKFNGKNMHDFIDWSQRTAVIWSVTRPDVYQLTEGQPRPTDAPARIAGVPDDEAADNAGDAIEDTGIAATPAMTTTTWDRANRDLYAALFLLTTGGASLLVRKHKQGTSGAQGNGQLAWQELTKKFRHPSKEKRRTLLAQLTEKNID